MHKSLLTLCLALAATMTSSARVPLECNTALHRQKVVAASDDWANKNGHTFCGAPALRAEDRVRAACEVKQVPPWLIQ